MAATEFSQVRAESRPPHRGRNRSQRDLAWCLSDYRPGTTLDHAEEIIGLERIEVAARMPIGYVLGRTSAFAHENPTSFTEAFAAEDTDTRDPTPRQHVHWLQRVNERRAKSDEQFVDHFRRSTTIGCRSGRSPSC